MISLEQYEISNRKSLKWLHDYSETSSDLDDVNRCILALLPPKIMLYHSKGYLTSNALLLPGPEYETFHLLFQITR